LNFKISVLGDVNKPGNFQLQSEKITIPEALALAGDLNITALRKNVVLIREKDGERTFIPIDLTSDNFFKSPYYYLRNNDVLYVEPGKTKYAGVDNNYRNVGIILSALSIIAIIITR